MRTAIHRLRDMLGTQAAIARCLEMTPQQINRISVGKCQVPAYMEAIVELLESLPRKDWPARFQKPDEH